MGNGWILLKESILHLFSLFKKDCNGGETRDRAHIYFGDAESINAGDSNSVWTAVTEAGVEGGEVIKPMDADVVYIATVPEPNRDANEEGAH